MQCRTCKTTGPGKVYGEWECPECVIKKEQAEHARKDKLCQEIQNRHAEKKCLLHIPAGKLPVDYTEEDIVREMRERLACSYSKEKDGTIILWAER